jgi:hypothetical protein
MGRWPHARRVEQMWRAADHADVRWRAVTMPPLRSHACVGRDTWPWADVGHWQAGPELFLIILKIFKHPNFKIQNGGLPVVYNSLHFE